MYINNVLCVSSGNYICKYNICYLHIMCAICKNERRSNFSSSQHINNSNNDRSHQLLSLLCIGLCWKSYKPGALSGEVLEK